MGNQVALVLQNGRFRRIAAGDTLEAPSFSSDGGVTSKRTPVSASQAIAADDYYLGVDTTAAVTLTLPTAVGKAGQAFIVKDETGGAASNPITLDTSLAELIDGVASVSVSVAYGVVGVVSTGTGWAIVPLLTQDWLTPSQHDSLRQLIHLADTDGPMTGFASGAYFEALPAGDPFPTSFTWYDKVGVGKKKIIEETLTYNVDQTVATDTFVAYDASEVAIVTMVDTYTYTDFLTPTVVRTWS